MPFLRRTTAASRALEAIKAARRRGEGLKMQDWHLKDFDPQSPNALEAVIEWCKHTLAECRRPYGINQFDLTLAFRAGNSERVRSFVLRKLEPIELYRDGFGERLLHSLGLTEPHRGPVRLSAAIFSWGDAAHRALTPRSQRQAPGLNAP
jgi:hypothetical protein